jgi:hypothetical protein
MSKYAVTYTIRETRVVESFTASQGTDEVLRAAREQHPDADVSLAFTNRVVDR